MKWWPWNKNEGTSTEKEAILPESVRYALANRNGRLQKTELRSLIRDGESETVRLDFVNVALYLTLKAYADNPEKEGALIQEIVSVRSQNSVNNETDMQIKTREVVENAIQALPDSPEWSVDARNLGGISRRGFNETNRRFKASASQYAQDERQVVIVGHAMFVGLPAFIDAFRVANRPLYIIIPYFLPDYDQNTGNGTFRNFPSGFVIEPNGKVRQIGKGDFNTPNGLVIIDDVRRKGETERKIRMHLKPHTARIDFEPLLDASKIP